MHSMDDVFERMQEFAQVLRRFQDAMEVSLADLGRRHAVLDPLWRDQWRKSYDLHYDPLHQALTRYVRQQGPNYMAFLHEKIQAIDRYLHG